jgi:hypothetical protein
MRFNHLLLAGLTAIGFTFGPGSQSARAFVTVAVLPTSQVTFVGSNAVFNAQVTATAGEIVTAYTWQMSTNGSGPFTTIPGATTATCTIPNVQLTDAGYYFVKVTYSSGTTNGLVSVSPAVTLVVPDQARIVTQPQTGLIRPTGTNVSFNVSALGTPPLGFQWRRNGSNLSDGGRISGATTTNLTIANLVTGDTGSYTVVVTNAYTAVTSQVATLNVYVPPSITVQPQDATVITGSNATFSVTATGGATLSYRWQHAGTNLSNGGRFSGATTNTLLITGALTNDAGLYTVSVSNIVGIATSSNATLTVLVPPAITSPTIAKGQQGFPFTFTNTASGSQPITFGVQGLPTGLSYEPTNGVISGIPAVSGLFKLAIFATNAAMTATGQLTLTLITGVPGITSSLSVTGKQGQAFSYSITASNAPTSFTASALPSGLNFNPATGLISGAPIVSGTFPITITASNLYGGDSQVMVLAIASSVPTIISPLTTNGVENQSGFSYTIQATDSPTVYGASGLPLGLNLNTNTGAITGTPLYGGTFVIPIWAINAWGTGTANLTLNIAFASLGGLALADVITNYSSPYLLDFTFSLRDNMDPSLAQPVVRPATDLQVQCFEDVTNPIPSEAPLILQSASKKQLKMFMALDYTYSMFSAPGAISNMEASAVLLINSEPSHALFGIIEFNADYMAPQFVTNRLTTSSNYFVADKAVLAQSIYGIQTNYVQGNYAGTRCWDAMDAALRQFPTNNAPDEQRYLVAMTDGNDDSSLLNTNASPLDYLVNEAQARQVRIFCVAFGPDINTNALAFLTSSTAGHYYIAATTADLGLQFTKIAKDIDGRYALRWATLRRAPVAFQPAFQVTLGTNTAYWNTNIIVVTNEVVDTNQMPPLTNTFISNIVLYPYNPANYTGDVRVGSIRLVPDSELGPQTIRLRGTYVPRSVREIQIRYRPNFPCTASLANTGPNEILNGWSMTETADTSGLRTLRMISANTNDLLTSIPYAAFGDLVTFQFAHPESLTATQAFSVFTNNNTIYTNYQPAGTKFVLQNGTNFVTAYPPTGPHGTPIPWLLFYGLPTNNLAAVEVSDPNGNGMPVWQEYLAGLNPTNVNSRFAVQSLIVPGQPPEIIFSTVLGRTYRVETATSLDSWSVLLDGIAGTGGNILFTDYRNLSGVSSVFYRVAVY